MWSSFFAGCLLLAGVCGVLSQCEPQHVEKCAGNLRSLYNSQDGPVIVKSESELKTLCTHQQAALVCINNFVDRCLHEPHKNIFNNMTSGVQEFVADFCSPQSPTRKVYVKHLSCFNKVADDVHHCTQRLHEWNKQMEKKQTNKEETMRQACCRYDSAMTCIRTVVRDGCPDEAADLFDDMINKVTKQFFQIADCGKHSYVLAECSGALSLSPLPVTFLTLSSLLVVLFSAFSKFW